MRSVLLPLLVVGSLLPLVSAAQSDAPHHRHAKRQDQTGEVTGRIELADGQAAEQVSVRVKGTSLGVNSAADGTFRLQAPAGWQVLTVTCLGCTPQEVTVEVKPGQTVAALPVRLAPGEQQLQEVTVRGAKSLNQRTPSVGKMPI